VVAVNYCGREDAIQQWELNLRRSNKPAQTPRKRSHIDRTGALNLIMSAHSLLRGISLDCPSLSEDLDFVLHVARRRAALIQELREARKAGTLDQLFAVVDKLTGIETCEKQSAFCE
jgi:hypothetical protein